MNPFPTAIFLFSITALAGQNFNRPVPDLVPPYEFVQNDTTFHGYYLTAPFRLNAGVTDSLHFPKPAMILDGNGYLLWYSLFFSENLLDFKYHPEQQLFSLINYKNQEDIRFMLLDTDFQFVDSFTTTNGIMPDLHEFQITKDQTYLLSGVYDTIIDLSGYLFNGVPGNSQTKVIGFAIQEFDADHQLLFQWKSTDHVHPSEGYAQYGYSAANFDYSHGNSIKEALDGDLLVSMRNTNAVYKIDRQTGAVKWRLGGKASNFTFPNDVGFTGQHDAQQLPNGNITLFDNANLTPPPRMSRALEYSLDTVNWMATKVWEYEFIPWFVSVAMGNHQTTPSHRHLVNFGFSFRPKPSFVLVNDAGVQLTRLLFQDSFMSYRTFIYDLPVNQLPRPEITCSQDGNTITLSAPAGYDRYAWSTGDNSASITIDQTGVYQVWVNHGIGMLGSEPFVVSDLSQVCPASSAESPEQVEDQRVLGLYDLLGRRLSKPLPGQMYVARYAHGQAKLMIRMR